MTQSKSAALGVSLGVICLGWIRQIAAGSPAQVLPETFGELVLVILRNKLVVLVAIALLLRLEGEGFERLGVTRREWPKHLGLGLAFGFVMFLGLNVALSAWMDSLIPRSATQGPSIADFFEDPRHLLLWLPIGILGGGVVEELQRIFVITRFEKWLGRPGLILGVVLSSVMFGFGHRYQGLGAALSTGVSGLVFALVYLRRRSALEPVTAHAFSDVLAMLAVTLLPR